MTSVLPMIWQAIWQMICNKGGWLLALAALCLWSSAACAHTRSVSYSFWTFTDQGAEVRARISQLELSRVGLLPEDPDYRQRAAQLLTTSLVLADNNGVCAVHDSLAPVLREGQLLHAWRVDCGHAPERVTSHLGQTLVSGHSHFLTAYTGAGPPITKVLTGQNNTLVLASGPATQSAPDGLLAFVKLGVTHILSGWDHLVFLLVLVVLATTLREVAWLATGFTLGHSITLAIAVLGLAQPAPLAVEALIALSIVGLALENGWRLDPRSGVLSLVSLPLLLAAGWVAGVLPGLVVTGFALFILAYAGLLRVQNAGFRLRLALTCAFGLIHGFGFAGVLTGMDLAPGRTVQALLGFNLGVEAGQLLLLALVWPILRWLQSKDWPAAQGLSATAAGIGVWVYLLRVCG